MLNIENFGNQRTWDGNYIFDSCDLTKSMQHPSNNFRCRICGPTLFIASYCIAENAKILRRDRFSFFRSLFSIMPVNSVLLVIETTHRLFPEIIESAFEGIDDNTIGINEESECDLHITFPRIRHNFRHGYSLCIQKVVQPRKRLVNLVTSRNIDVLDCNKNDFETSLISRMKADPDTKSLLSSFIRDNQLHERRLINQHEQKILEQKLQEELRQKKLNALRLKLNSHRAKEKRNTCLECEQGS